MHADTLRQRFREDRLGLTAGSLTFTTTIAVVPLFTVMLALFSAFPVFARFSTPIDIVGAWRAEAFSVPIAIGGLQVLPDDFILADRDGIVLIGKGCIEAVIQAAESKMATEGDMVKAIRAGEDPQAAYLRHRVF